MNFNPAWFLYRQPDASKDIIFVFPCGVQAWYHSNSSIKGTKYGGERPQLAVIKHTVPNVHYLVGYLERRRPDTQPNGLLELNRRIEALNMVLLIKG